MFYNLVGLTIFGKLDDEHEVRQQYNTYTIVVL